MRNTALSLTGSLKHYYTLKLLCIPRFGTWQLMVYHAFIFDYILVLKALKEQNEKQRILIHTSAHFVILALGIYDLFRNIHSPFSLQNQRGNQEPGEVYNYCICASDKLKEAQTEIKSFIDKKLLSNYKILKLSYAYFLSIKQKKFRGILLNDTLLDSDLIDEPVEMEFDEKEQERLLELLGEEYNKLFYTLWSWLW